jgi:hypothetical protein
MTAFLLRSAVCAALFVATVSFAQSPDSPHYMRTKGGEADSEKCSACHEEDMSLSRTKLETCTLCHATTVHSGAAQHLEAPAASVQQRLAASKQKSEWPLTEEGQIYCGTCHLFHDPAVLGEPWQSESPLPPAAGLAEAVRRARSEQWPGLASKYEEVEAGARFSQDGTRALRLPASDGTLCKHCHEYGK